MVVFVAWNSQYSTKFRPSPRTSEIEVNIVVASFLNDSNFAYQVHGSIKFAIVQMFDHEFRNWTLANCVSISLYILNIMKLKCILSSLPFPMACIETFNRFLLLKPSLFIIFFSLTLSTKRIDITPGAGYAS